MLYDAAASEPVPTLSTTLIGLLLVGFVLQTVLVARAGSMNGSASTGFVIVNGVPAHDPPVGVIVNTASFCELDLLVSVIEMTPVPEAGGGDPPTVMPL